MEFVSIIFASSCLFVVLVCVYMKGQEIGGKKYHPIGGSLFNKLINYNRLHDYMTDLAAKYKTYRINTPFRGEVYTSDPANIEYILKTNFQNYGKGEYFHTIMKELLGDGIFAVDGDKWRQQRKVSSGEFSTKILRDFSTIIFRNHAIKLGNVLSQAATTKQQIDISELIMKATMDSVFKVGFGIDLDNMSGSVEEGVRFSRAFDDANTLITRRSVDLSWKIKRFFNVGSESDLKTSIKLINDFVYKLIHKKSKQIHDSSKLQEDQHINSKEDILSRFMQQMNDDPKYLRDVVLNFLLAGKDTIAITMTWFIYMLCKHPQIQEKVAKEIKQATNQSQNHNHNHEDNIVADLASCVNEDALQNLNYLHAALTETMRLYPAVPMDPKICFGDDVLPDGYSVKKGDMVTYMPYAMGRMEFLWGNDAHQFKPERWLDHNVDAKKGKYHHRIHGDVEVRIMVKFNTRKSPNIKYLSWISICPTFSEMIHVSSQLDHDFSLMRPSCMYGNTVTGPIGIWLWR
ncbi:hypothetical protein E3N88_26671 [Mikania micrantha]|uniref:Cytochrome P450 n=1 Tax=Mikania micrantha TaxID=192012 RepID=A0A5N6MVK3_9ASTR|nr:hypothetical protein E3N88_26671 [Mikania micrantha]